MTDKLRDRIAAALQAADEDWITYTNPYEDMADAVIAALQLEERTRNPVTAYIDGQFQENQTLHRYVTPWKVK